MSFQLRRVAILNDGAFGVLMQNGVPFAVTLERTYEPGNTVKIGNGFHECRRSRYNKGSYDTYEIEVPGHSRILFHKGNTELHSDGCVLVAESFAVLGDKPGVALSAEGFNEFMKRVQEESFTLEVT
jgi:uncharacterized protein DUF5675